MGQIILGLIGLYVIYKCGGYIIAWYRIVLRHYVILLLQSFVVVWLEESSPELVPVEFICYLLLLVVAEKRVADSEIADMLERSFDYFKIIPISDINMCRPLWEKKVDSIKKWFTPADAPQKIAEKWVSEGELQKKELWDKTEYYYRDEEFVQNMYRETMSMAISCVDPLLNDKGVYFDTVHINQLDEYINSGAEGSSMPHLKRAILEKYLADKNLYIGNISSGNKVYINVQVVEDKLLAPLAESGIFDINQIVNNAGAYSKDFLQGIMTNVHGALPDLSYVMLREGNGTLWVHNDYKAFFTCVTCGKPSKTIQEYRSKRYCADCLKKLHAKEADGKTVKRYIDAPPPGVVIKQKRCIDAPPPGVVISGGTESANAALLSEEEED